MAATGRHAGRERVAPAARAIWIDTNQAVIIRKLRRIDPSGVEVLIRAAGRYAKDGSKRAPRTRCSI